MLSIIRSVASLTFGVFYRRRQFGAEIPIEGPAILVANHPNGLVDPIALMLATSRPPRFLAKAPLFKMPVIGALMRGMGALPVFRSIDGANTSDNQSTFAKVFEALANEQLVCLFPEGISHSEPDLQTLKTGAARMALGAEAAASSPLGIKIVPVGLIYGRKSRFRSRMAIWVGEPITVHEFAELHRRDERAAARALTEQIALSLRQVTIQLTDWQDLPLIELAERLLPDDEDHAADRTRALAEGLHRLREDDPKAASQLQRQVSDFRDRLELVQLAPEDLDLRYNRSGVASFALRTSSIVLLTLPLAILGAAFWWLPFQLTGLICRRRRVDADIIATQKFLVGLFLFPIWWLLLVGIAWDQTTVSIAVLTAAITPVLGILTLRFGDRFRTAKRDVSSFLRFNAADGLKAKLQKRRDELLESIRKHASEQRK